MKPTKKPRSGIEMVKRKRVRVEEEKTSYFTGEKPDLHFISSGCTLLDCALGGGYAMGRMVNVVGDKSTAKTALATEATTNFCLKHADSKPAYRESEAAFDHSYAAAMGLPLERVDFGDEDNPLLTVEDFSRDFDKYLVDRIKHKTPGMYTLDSLDSLSDDNEMEQDIGKGTYGMQKAKSLSIFFRTHIRKIEKANTLLFIVSQVRDNIGVTFGEKHRRAGGKAMDFYASQILWLAHVETLKQTIKKVERPYGVVIRANIKKNKVGLPFRKIDFVFRYGFGVDDVVTSANWLKKVERLEDADIDTSPKGFKQYLEELENASDAEYRKEQQSLAKVVKKVWADIETTFLPKRSKY